LGLGFLLFVVDLMTGDSYYWLT